MIFKVTVFKGGSEVFSVNINVAHLGEFSTGVKAAVDEFHRLKPQTSLTDGDLNIKIEKA